MSRLSFSGAKLKVKRAQKHIGELEAWLCGAVQTNIDEILTHRHTRGTDGTAVESDPSPTRLTNPGPIVGDVVHNLRSSLDHCAFAIVEAAGEDASGLYFPMSDTRKALIGSCHYALIQRVAPDFAAVIADVIKPYKAANHPLWALNQLDRMDKHRFLVPTMARSSFGIVGITEEQEDNPPPLKQGNIFCVMRRAPSGIAAMASRAPRAGTAAYIQNQRNGHLATEIRFDVGSVFENEPVIPTLHQLAELVGKAIEALGAV